MLTIFAEKIADKTGLSKHRVSNALLLFDEGCTLPFIARYRKEKTDSLNETELWEIEKLLKQYEDIAKRQNFIKSKLESLGVTDAKLIHKINQCWDLNALEDLYLPYKVKKSTKASVAKKLGLEPLARSIYRERTRFPYREAKRYIKQDVASAEDAIEGAKHIIAEWISEHTTIRDIARQSFHKSASINSKVKTKKKIEATKFKDYFDFSQSLHKIPSHRLLAILRAEKEGFLKVNLEIDQRHLFDNIRRYLRLNNDESSIIIEESVEDCLRRLLLPSMENETRKLAKEKADQEAIQVFSNNLSELLLAAPIGEKATMALDPGYRTGCKLVCLDNNGKLLYHTTIFPHPPQNKVHESKQLIKQLAFEYSIEAIAVGNGTAGKESYQLVKNIDFTDPVDVYFVNESGASIYSASPLAVQEFPDKDVTVRGAVSIGRRLMDPLAELVKIDAKSIGVGQYQHDVNQKLLRENLDTTVQSCVNKVGVNLNTGSASLLAQISGLGPTLANNIVAYRNNNGSFSERKELLKVPRLGAKAYEQAAGFLRIRDGKNPLDNTGVHPESYSVTKKILKDLKLDLKKLQGNEILLDQIVLEKYVSATVGLPTLRDIIKELKQPGLDIRGEAKVFEFNQGLQSINDLSIDMMVKGVINNLTKFGAFVDIGIKASGLIHISQIANRFIKDPAEVLKINQEVEARVIDIDIERGRISLSLKE